MNNKERRILSKLYANHADTYKYLPFFFKNKEDLIEFFAIFGGKTIKVPNNYKEFVENYFKSDTICSTEIQGIRDINKLKTKILESYINLFDSFEAVIKFEYDKDKLTESEKNKLYVNNKSKGECDN